MKVDEILSKYEKKLNENVESDTSNFTNDYSNFKKEMIPQFSSYEKLCLSFGKIIAVKLAKKDEEKLSKNINNAHIEVTPSNVISTAFVMSMLFFVSSFLVVMITYLAFSKISFLVILLLFFASGFIFYYFYSMPLRLANKWRLKASSQMVPCILYIVAYMKHTSNLERAVAFASQHLAPPLSLDLKKVFWDVQTGKYGSVKESLDNYLEQWRETNIEFIESFHLIESSLYEPSEERRVQILERALQVILDGIYEKMLSYSREVRSPLTSVYMLGIVLPTLGVALLPLASVLLGGVFQWYHVFIIFNLLIPFLVFYLISQVLVKRPGGYGESDILEKNPNYFHFSDKKVYYRYGLIFLPLIILGILPFLFRFGVFGKTDYTFAELGLNFLGEIKLFFFTDNGNGPFGIGAVILSLFIPLALGLFFSYAYKKRTEILIEDRNNSKNLEEEFTNSLFQLGNRLGDGMPAEIAFASIASSNKGQVTEGFFKTVNTNIQQLGMSVEQAIFNNKRGAIIFYPSALIATSMKILVESVKKGLQIAARSLMSISDYVKNIHKINERVRDLLAEVVSDMKSNMTFLAPLLSGIIIGLSTMITLILSKLQTIVSANGDVDLAVIGNAKEILDLFNVANMIPPYFLQISIGIYLVEIVFILSSALVVIDAGEDKLKEVYEIGRNLKKSVIFYAITALISIIALGLLASVALGGMAG